MKCLNLKLLVLVDFLLLNEVSAFLLQDGRDLYRCPQNVRSLSRVFTYDRYCIEFMIGKHEYWSDARAHCHQRGGTLVTIPDARTQAFLMQALHLMQYDPDGKGFWIGLNDRSHEKQYNWDDGQQLHGYTNWGKNEPSSLFHSIQDCIILQYHDNGHWWDEPCRVIEFTYNYICQYDMLPTTTIKTTIPTKPTTTTAAATTNTSTVLPTTAKPSTPVPTTLPPTSSSTSHALTTTTVACQDIDCQKSCPGGYSGVYVAADGCVTCRCN